MAIVPVGELRRLRAVEARAPTDILEAAEAMRRSRCTMSGSQGRRPGARLHDDWPRTCFKARRRPLRSSKRLAAITFVRTESFCTAEVITVSPYLAETAPVPATPSASGRDLLALDDFAGIPVCLASGKSGKENIMQPGPTVLTGPAIQRQTKSQRAQIPSAVERRCRMPQAG